MNILTILNKLKEKKMIPDSEEALTLFSDSFNKFGISLLLLKDENKFNQIVDLLEENAIPLQKVNGMFALRIFSVETSVLKEQINLFFAINEMSFLRNYPEFLAEPKNIHTIAENMKKYQCKNISYKDNDMYNLSMLLNYEEKKESFENGDVNAFLKTILQDPSLIDKIENLESSGDEEDFNVALELQKVENKICEDYLLPVDDGWKIIIHNKEVNSFQEVKNTISTIIKLNLPISFQDALFIVLFYKSNLSIEEIKEIIDKELTKGGE